jgi:hypothetical protein
MYHSSIPQAAIPVARETLALSDSARGLSGMTQPNVGMTNMDTGRAYANASAATAGQMEEQMQLAGQEVQQNMQTAQYQQNVGMRGEAIKASTQMNDAQSKAQSMLANGILDQLDARGNGGALMQLNALVQSPEREAFVNNMATAAAMRNQQAPELGAYQASTQQYKPM